MTNRKKINKLLIVTVLSGAFASEALAYDTYLRDVFYSRSTYNTNDADGSGKQLQYFTSSWLEFGDDGSSVSTGLSTTYEKVYTAKTLGNDRLYFDANKPDHAYPTMTPDTYLIRNFDASTAIAMTVELDRVDNGSGSGVSDFHGNNRLYVKFWDAVAGQYSTVCTIAPDTYNCNGAITAGMMTDNSSVKIVPNNWNDGSSNHKSEVGIGSIIIKLTYPTTDRDHDDVPDWKDIDNDNDGILDRVESSKATPIDAQNLKTIGSATRTSSLLTLTEDTGSQRGALNTKYRIDMRHDWAYRFTINAGASGTGGEGMAFVLHNDPQGENALGALGAGMGALGSNGSNGIKNGVAIEIDTFPNTYDETGPVVNNNRSHAQIRKSELSFDDPNGALSSATPIILLDSGGTAINGGNIADGQDHTFTVHWNASVQELSYQLTNTAGAYRFTSPNGIKDIIGDDFAFVSLTAATSVVTTNKQTISKIEFFGYIDTDGDGVVNKFDLDSDNDGIPDNVEAQPTVGYKAPSYNVNAEGLQNDVYGSGLTPHEAEAGGTPDYIDYDSDSDRVNDCDEGIKPGAANGTKVCPVNVGDVDIVTGIVNWAEGDNTTAANPYADVNGRIIGTALSDALMDFVPGTTELAYREVSHCGNTLHWGITSFNWKTISIPCQVDDTIGTLFADLGTYGDTNNWVMYRQDGNNWSGASGSMVQMSDTEKMEPGLGYWIIADSTKNIDINETDLINPLTAGPLTPVVTDTAQPGSHFESRIAFNEVLRRTPNIATGSSKHKFLVGNPFPLPIHVGNIFVTGDDGANYYPLTMANVANSFFEGVVYTHDSTDTGSTPYIPKSAFTPGFGDTIDPGVGFWMGDKPEVGANIIGWDLPYEYNRRP